MRNIRYVEDFVGCELMDGPSGSDAVKLTAVPCFGTKRHRRSIALEQEGSKRSGRDSPLLICSQNNCLARRSAI